MRSKKRTIGILIVVIVVLLGFAGSLLVYRNKLLSENAKKLSDESHNLFHQLQVMDILKISTINQLQTKI